MKELAARDGITIEQAQIADEWLREGLSRQMAVVAARAGLTVARIRALSAPMRHVDGEELAERIRASRQRQRQRRLGITPQELSDRELGRLPREDG